MLLLDAFAGRGPGGAAGRGPHRRFTLGVDTSQNASQTKGKAMMLCASTYAAMSAKMTWCMIAVGSPSSRKWMSIEARSYTR